MTYYMGLSGADSLVLRSLKESGMRLPREQPDAKVTGVSVLSPARTKNPRLPDKEEKLSSPKEIVRDEAS
jgi:hypothetical protein